MLKKYFSLSSWLFLRALTSLAAIIISMRWPVLPLEEKMPVWPPAQPMDQWLNRIFLAPWLRWDANIYVRILTGGYIAWDGSTSFHPLFIWLSTPLYWLGITPALSLMLTGSLAGLGLFMVFYQFARLDLSPEESQFAVALLATFPVSVILFAPYTESLFMLFSTLALYLMRRRHWLCAALITFLASLTRQQGVFLVFPILWLVWEDSGKKFGKMFKDWRGWLAAISAPLGLLVWSFYRIGVLHEGTLDWSNWQGFIYSILLSPSAKVIFPDQAIMWPWNAFIIAAPKLLSPDIGDVMSIALGFWFLLIFIKAWKYMPPDARLYSLVITFISFSMSTGNIRIYLSLPRHLFVAVPVFVGLAKSLKPPRQKMLFIGIQFALFLFMLFLYVAKMWIP